VKNVATGKLAVYAGCEVDLDSPEKSGLYVFTPNEMRANSEEYTHLKDENGRVVVGAFVELVGNMGFFGRIDRNKLTDEQWHTICKICAS